MLLEVLLVLSAILFLLYKYGTATYTYWTDRGVYQIKPYPFIGSSLDLLLGRVSQIEDGINTYNKVKDRRYGGVYQIRTPALLITDPDLIKNVTIKDFDHFINHAPFVDEKTDILFGRSLFSLKNQRWRDMRNTMTPAFTGSKMKNMFNLIDQGNEYFTKYIQEKIEEQVKAGKGDVWTTDIKIDLFSKFTNDVTASAAFGLKVDSLRDPDNEFYKLAKHITDFSGTRFFLSFLIFAAPKLTHMLRISLFGKKTEQFFINLVTETIKARQEKKIIRPDMIHLLMQARQGTLQDNTDHAVPVKQIEISDLDATGQASSFIFAGYETLSTILSFTCHELAVNRDVYDKLQNEIDTIVEEDDGKLTYEGVVHKMTYLDQVLSEVLRKWPPVPILDREVNKTYVIPGNGVDKGVTLEPGTQILLPVIGLHMDPKYYPDPLKFDPERFNDENKTKIHPGAYLPFGIGPRNCIGNRFALMVVKVCLVNMMRNFELVPVEGTQEPLVLKKASFTNTPENGFILGIKRKVY